MPIATITSEKQIIKVSRKPIEYLYNYLKTNNNTIPHFNTTITHITRNTTYLTVVVEYNKYKIVTTSSVEDIAKQNAAQTLYYLLTDERMPESKYGDYTNIVATELEEYCIVNKIEIPKYSYIKTKISDKKFNCIAICKINNLRFSGMGRTCLYAKIAASLKALKALKFKST